MVKVGAMSRNGKTWKDQFKRADKAVKEPRPQEKGGMRNLIREAQEEDLQELDEALQELSEILNDE